MRVHEVLNNDAFSVVVEWNRLVYLTYWVRMQNC